MVCGTSRLTTKVPAHHNALNFKFLQHPVNCSMFTVSVHFNCSGFSSFNVHGSLSLVTHLISSFCPIYLFYIYVLHRTQYTHKILIHCDYKFIHSMKPLISIYFLLVPSHIESFYTDFYILSLLRCQWAWFITLATFIFYTTYIILFVWAFQFSNLTQYFHYSCFYLTHY